MDGFIICIISIGNLIQKLQNEPDIVAGSIIRKGIGCDGRVYVESMDEGRVLQENVVWLGRGVNGKRKSFGGGLELKGGSRRRQGIGSASGKHNSK